MATASIRTIRATLANRLSPARWAHTLGVASTAVVLADRFGARREAARLAGLLHDYARELPPAQLLALAKSHGLTIDPIESREPLLLHGKVGAAMAASDFGVSDREVLEAIAVHVTGEPGMPLLAKLVFLADFIEPGRNMAAAAIAREAARQDLNKALLIAFDSIIQYVHANGYLLHPRCVAARAELAAAGKS